VVVDGAAARGGDDAPPSHAGASGRSVDRVDRELLARHVAGDPEAFGVLVRRHRDRLWAVALRTLGDREEAADALQDAFVSAFRAAHTFRGKSAVTTWLHRITVNACLDRARKAASHRAAPVCEAERLDELIEPYEPADAPAERDELQAELIRVLATLPVDQRAALVLVDMAGYPVAEAADVLGVPVGTVKSRCARGRARLLPLLSHLRTSHSGDEGAGRGRNQAEEGPVKPTSARRRRHTTGAAQPEQDGGGRT
jgi:RNA polymerase sigma-70 factor, ECF subfamily